MTTIRKPRITSIRHVAFVVKNLTESVKFYRDILGLELYSSCREKGCFIDALTGIPNVDVEWVKLVIPRGGLIELLQYHSHPDPDSDFSGEVKRCDANRLGCSHVALTVTDLQTLYEDLIEHGYSCKSEPLMAPSGKAKLLYAMDPDGAIIELIEDL